VTRRLPHLLPWLMALLLTAPAAWLLLQGDVYVGNGTDLFSYQLPLRQMVGGALRSGHWPSWNPYELGGVPAHAGMQLGLGYAPDLLLPLIAGIQACAWLFWLHLVWLAVGTWRLAGLHLGPRPPGWRGWLPLALAAAIVAGSGPTWGHIFAGHVSLVQAWAWLPWVWALAIQALQTRTATPLLLGMGALGAQILAGHPQVTYLTLAGLTFLLLGHALQPHEPAIRTRLHAWPGSVAAVAVLAVLILGGCWLAALQWLPTLHVQAELNRTLATPEDIAFAYSAPARTLLTLVAPQLWGSPTQALPEQSYHETLAFLGGSALALALLGALVGGMRAWLALAGVLVCALLSLGDKGPLLPALLGLVPGIGSFRVPGRWILPMVALLALLAAQGLDWLLRSGDRPKALKSPPLPQAELALPPWLAMTLSGSLALALVSLAGGIRLESGWWHDALGGKPVPQAWQVLVDASHTDLTVAALACVAVALAIARPGWRIGLGVALTVLAVGQSLGLSVAHLDRKFFKPQAAVHWSEADRATLARHVGSRHRLATAANLRLADWGGQAGVAMAGAYEPAVTVQTNRYGNLLAGRAIDGYAVNFQVRHPSAWLDRLAVSHALVTAQDRSFADWPEVARLDSGLVLRRHPQPLDRFGFARGVVVEPDAHLAVQRLSGLPVETVVLSSALPHDDAAQGTLEPLEDTPDHLTLQVTTDKPAVIVVRDALGQGWQAEVDGQPTQIALADGLFRAAVVPAGSHRLTWQFAVPGLRPGLWLSLCGWLAWALGLLWQRRQKAL
jgi:hypothetical protein